MTSFLSDGRWTDAWVVDRTLFEHLSGGSCSCCGIAHANAGALMANCSDLETDDGRKERRSPWPPAMSEDVWAGRVKLRIAMKEEMRPYKQFWEEHGEGFSEWWKREQPREQRRILSMPTDEVPAILHGKYDLRGAYSVVMCVVNEQLRNFDKTGIRGDGRTAAGLAFEEGLQVSRGAYVGNAFVGSNRHDVFFALCQQTGAPRLLPSNAREKHARNTTNVNTNLDTNSSSSSAVDTGVGIGVDGDDRVDGDASEESQSFRADRRLIRLIVFRYMFDKSMRRYRESVAASVEISPPSPAKRKNS